ncbi:MAG TPA: hypothetical protein VKR52_04700 [Terracidiphilus sp.]|nr:hypothetical protein [Terracidiphilus sp.]
MKSRPTGPDQTILSSHGNDRRDDARGSAFLLAHQQLGVIALPTNPTNNQTLTLTINGTAIVVTFVSSIGSTANIVLIGGSAAATTQNLVNFLRRPDLTSTTQVAATSGNQSLLQYCGYGWPGSSTNIVPFSLNKNVNGLAGLLSSFTASTTVTGGSWTAQTMQLYVEDGTYFIGTTRVLFTGGSTPTVTAPVSHPRIDVLSINSSGVLSWTTGTESVTPSAPTYPTGVMVICELYNVVGETALYDNENQQTNEGYIYNDVRPTLGGTYISSASQVASGLFIPDPGSEAQGDVLYYNGSAWARLPAGTSGQVLMTKGASANPTWSAAPSGFGLTGTANGSNYSSSSTSYVDVDATNLKVTLTGLTVGKFLYLQCYAQYETTGSNLTNGVQLQDTTNSITLVTGPASSGSTYTINFSGLYKIASATTTISLQYKTTTNNALLLNSAAAFTPGGNPAWFTVTILN